MKESSTWYSARLQQDVRTVRWGHYGSPVLIFPTAGGDAEEIERFQLIGALWPLIEGGRIKVYSCDSVAGRAWISNEHSQHHCAWLQNRYDGFIYHEVVPAIRADCHSEDIEIVTAGASIGAFNAVASLCRHPDVFRLAIGMSGTYDLERLFQSPVTEDFYFSSPLHYLPGLSDSAQLWQLQQRFVLLAYGQGRWDNPDESWRLANVLGAKGVPNRVDPWGVQYDHDWPAWREILPGYLAEMV